MPERLSAAAEALVPGIEKRICRGCGETFEARTKVQRYCTLACFELHTRGKRRLTDNRTLLLPLLAALALMPALARAGSLTLSWGAPVAYSDGTPLPASDIAYYTLTWRGATSEDWMPFDSEELPPTVTAASIPVICGSYSVTLTVTTTMTAAEPNASSFPAGPIVYDTGITCPPAAATSVQVQPDN